MMKIKLSRHSSIYILDVVGEMDLYNSFQLKTIVSKMMEKNIKSYIINLENVEYIDSSGIGALIHVYSVLKKAGMRLKIVNVHGSVKRVIELTKLMGYFPMANNIKEAIEQMKESTPEGE